MASDAAATEFSDDEIRSLLQLSDDQLFSSLVPEGARWDMHHEGARVARGKAIFAKILRSARGPICSAYNARTDLAKDSIELVILVAGVIIGSARLSPADPLALAAAVLVVKMGVDIVCQGVE